MFDHAFGNLCICITYVPEYIVDAITFTFEFCLFTFKPTDYNVS